MFSLNVLSNAHDLILPEAVPLSNLTCKFTTLSCRARLPCPAHACSRQSAVSTVCSRIERTTALQLYVCVESQHSIRPFGAERPGGGLGRFPVASFQVDLEAIRAAAAQCGGWGVRNRSHLAGQQPAADPALLQQAPLGPLQSHKTPLPTVSLLAPGRPLKRGLTGVPTCGVTGRPCLAGNAPASRIPVWDHPGRPRRGFRARTGTPECQAVLELEAVQVSIRLGERGSAEWSGVAPPCLPGSWRSGRGCPAQTCTATPGPGAPPHRTWTPRPAAGRARRGGWGCRPWPWR